MKLKEPSEYLEALEDLRKKYSYAKHWKIHLTALCNRHPDLYGKPWGWYEIEPFGIDVGIWASDRDDLEGVDISAWNEEAERISRID